MSWRKQYKAAIFLGKSKKKIFTLEKELSNIRRTNSQFRLTHSLSARGNLDFSKILLLRQGIAAQQQASPLIGFGISCLAGLFGGNQ